MNNSESYNQASYQSLLYQARSKYRAKTLEYTNNRLLNKEINLYLMRLSTSLVENARYEYIRSQLKATKNLGNLGLGAI